MSEDESVTGVVGSRRRFEAAGVLLLAVVVAPLFAWIVFGAVCYVGGLRNSPGCFRIIFILPPLLLFALIASPILIVRTFFDWRKYSRRRQCRHALLTVLAVGSLAFLGWCIVLSPVCSPGTVFMWGFRRYVQSQADIKAIRAWLDTADAEAAAVQSGHWSFRRSEWPTPIARLGPRYVSVSPDEEDRLTVRLAWADRLGQWGIVVGQKDMPVPPSDPYDRRLPLAAGAYVWSGD